MPHPITLISNFTYSTLNKELNLTAVEKENTEVFLKAYADDFWQSGRDTLLPPSQGGFSGTIDSLLQKRYVFRNVIRECVGRVSGAFFGKAPNWKYQISGKAVERPRSAGRSTAVAPVDTEGDQPEMAVMDLTEIDKALGDFWTSQSVADVMKEAFESRLVFGRGGIRIYLPTKFKRKNLIPEEQEDGTTVVGQFVAFLDIPSAISAMRIEFIPPTESRCLDEEGELFSLVKYSKRSNWETQEETAIIEFSFVDDVDQTFLGSVSEKDSVGSIVDANLSSPLYLGGRPTFNEFKGRPFVTKALYRNNMLLNLALTCAGFSLVDNGFGEMILTNVELETESVVGPDGDTIDVPRRIKRGGGVVQNFMGVKNYDEATGAVQQLQPGVTFKEPSTLSPYRDGAAMAYESCLSEAGQLYALIVGDASPSGESRIQALGDFVLKVLPHKAEVDEMGSWVMSTVLLWAAQLAGQQMEGYSIMFDSRMQIANLSNEERRMIMEMRDKGAISRETERVLLGVDDPALEAELVLREQMSTPTQTTVDQFSERLDVGQKMLGLGIDPLTVQSYLGYTEAEMQVMADRAAENEARIMAQIEAQNNQGNPDDLNNPDDSDETAPLM